MAIIYMYEKLALLLATKDAKKFYDVQNICNLFTSFSPCSIFTIFIFLNDNWSLAIYLGNARESPEHKIQASRTR